MVSQIRTEINDPTKVRERVRSQPHSQERESFVKCIYLRENLSNFDKLWGDCFEEKTRMESKSSKKCGDENLALFGQSNKGRGKGPNKGREGVRSQPYS